MKRRLNIWMSVLVLSTCLALEGQDKTFSKISSSPSFPYADGWLGGDGALSVQLSDTRVLWIMSDSYVSRRSNASKRRKANTIVNNVVALAEYDNSSGSPVSSMHYYWRRSGRKHRAFFAPDTGVHYFWPTFAFLKNDTIFVLMSAVEHREDAGPDEVFSFRHRGLSLAIITGIEREDPLQWDVKILSYEHLYPDESLNQAGKDESYLYVFKHVNQENFLTRIPLNALMHPDASVEYWSSRGTWNKGSTGEDREILFTGQSNGSLEYYPELGHWLHIYGPNFLSNEIGYRIARQITGPWSDPGVLYRTPEQTPGHPSYDQRHFCYLARAHSGFYDPAARKLLITYDCNSVEFFHAAGSDFIYIPRVLSMDVPLDIP